MTTQGDEIVLPQPQPTPEEIEEQESELENEGDELQDLFEVTTEDVEG